jgi:hypothetical protein
MWVWNKYVKLDKFKIILYIAHENTEKKKILFISEAPWEFISAGW